MLVHFFILEHVCSVCLYYNSIEFFYRSVLKNYKKAFSSVGGFAISKEVINACLPTKTRSFIMFMFEVLADEKHFIATKKGPKSENI